MKQYFYPGKFYYKDVLLVSFKRLFMAQNFCPFSTVTTFIEGILKSAIKLMPVSIRIVVTVYCKYHS